MVLLRRWILSVSVFALLVGGLVQPLPLSSQTTSDFFLHGAGATANPPTLFLDTTAPTATTEKYKDSTSLNFNGGNLWKAIGTWPADPTLTSGTLSALTDLHVWLGLQNSNDQGTSFDLLAELYKNGVLVTSGLTRCITGVTRNPSLAKEVTATFGSFTPASLNGTTDTLSLKIWTRIGTNPDNTKCAGHNNAVGLRLYFDATSRQARFGATFSMATSGPLTQVAPVFVQQRLHRNRADCPVRLYRQRSSRTEPMRPGSRRSPAGRPPRPRARGRKSSRTSRPGTTSP